MIALNMFAKCIEIAVSANICKNQQLGWPSGIELSLKNVGLSLRLDVLFLLSI